MSARVVKLILSNDVLLGKGTEDSIMRRAWTLYTLDGQHVGQWDGNPSNDEPMRTEWHDPVQLGRLMSDGE